MSKLELRDVSFCYGEKGRLFRALDQVDLTIEEGEFVCIIGRSGCGKTTLLRLLSGLTTPTEGQVLMNGKPLEGPSPKTAYVFQQYTLFPWMKVIDNVIFGIQQADASISKVGARKTAQEMLQAVDMLEAADKYPNELSGGMKQRVAIARALAMRSEILLMDEPFGALDSKTRRSLRKLLETLWMKSEPRRTVVMVTHNIREAVKLADKIIFMTPGHVEAVIQSTLPRPRCPINTAFTCELQDLEKKLIGLFYETGNAEDKEDA